jgi:hypothetical protein
MNITINAEFLANFKQGWLNTKELVAFLSNLDRAINNEIVTVCNEVKYRPLSI